MKSIINRNNKHMNLNKVINHKRHSSITLDSKNKISNFVINKEIPSLFKMNKTIQKYINEKLSTLKTNIHPNKESKDISRNINNNILPKKNFSFNKNIRNKSRKTSKNNKIKGRNDRNENQLLKNEYMTNEINIKYKDIENIFNNNTIQSRENIKKKINEKISYLIKNKEPLSTTKGKLVKDFYQNYSSSMSMSTGISLNHNNEIIYKENKQKDNNTINSNNNYEIDSTEEDNIHEIIFKGMSTCSQITFGNSFSYTNSKRSSNSKSKDKNEERKEKNDKSFLLLKNQNETLRKELKESNKQIMLLKKEIQNLVKNRKMNITNYKCYLNAQKKNLDYKPKIFSKNSSYLDNINYDIDKSHYKSEIRTNKNMSNKSCNYKRKLLNKNNNKIK